MDLLVLMPREGFIRLELNDRSEKGSTELNVVVEHHYMTQHVLLHVLRRVRESSGALSNLFSEEFQWKA